MRRFFLKFLGKISMLIIERIYTSNILFFMRVVLFRGCNNFVE